MTEDEETKRKILIGQKIYTEEFRILMRNTLADLDKDKQYQSETAALLKKLHQALYSEKYLIGSVMSALTTALIIVAEGVDEFLPSIEEIEQQKVKQK